MNKAQMLEIIKLLSALESWSFGAANPLPDYLGDRMDSVISELSEYILKVDSGAHVLRVDSVAKNVRD